MTALKRAFERGIRRGETRMLEKLFVLGAAAFLGYIYRESLG